MLQLTIKELKSLLDQQRMITISKCLSHSYIYNKATTEAEPVSLNIDDCKFRQNGKEAGYPDDFNVLVKYLDK